MKIDGGCHCGNITFVADIDPNGVRICHCTDCQHLTGTAYRVNVTVPKDKITFSGGKAKTYIKTAESGTKRAHWLFTGKEFGNIASALRHAMRSASGRGRSASHARDQPACSTM